MKRSVLSLACVLLVVAFCDHQVVCGACIEDATQIQDGPRKKVVAPKQPVSIVAILASFGLLGAVATSVGAPASESESGQMGQFTKFVAWGGFVAAIGLCIFDFVTSVQGIRLILGTRDDNPIAVFMPIIFALLAICFNGLSPFMFRYYMRHGFSGFAPTVTSVMWMFFVGYDFVSSFVGMLDTYSTVRITSWPAVVQGVQEIGGAGAFFVTVMAILLSFGPFLATMMYQLATSSD